MAVTKIEKTVPKDEKTELIRQLNEEGHEDYCGINLKDLTTGELKTLLKEVTEGTQSKIYKANAMAGISSLNRPYLLEIAKGLGETGTEEMTKDKLLLTIRASRIKFESSRLTFGRYKGQQPSQALTDKGYMTWLEEEAEKSKVEGGHPHKDFTKLYTYHLLRMSHFQELQKEARKS